MFTPRKSFFTFLFLFTHFFLANLYLFLAKSTGIRLYLMFSILLGWENWENFVGEYFCLPPRKSNLVFFFVISIYSFISGIFFFFCSLLNQLELEVVFIVFRLIWTRFSWDGKTGKTLWGIFAALFFLFTLFS